MKSLFKLSVEAVVSCIHTRHAEDVSLLPPQLKSRLLKVACKRGNLNSSILHCLLHSDVHELDLNECIISDNSLGAVCKCKQLRTLDINYYKKEGHFSNITTAALIDLFPNLHYLTVLHLQHCNAVTDEVVISIADNCPLLCVMDVGGCRQITDRSLRKITESLLQITSLNISESQVTDVGILSLVKGVCGETLLELHMDFCKGITNFAIEAITLYCIKLKILQFHGCTVTEECCGALDSLFGNSKVQQLSWTIY